MTRVVKNAQGYELEILDQRLGGGSFGVVKKGILYKQNEKIDVAVKILTDYRKYAKTQFETLCKFKENYGIVTAYGIVETKDQTMIILELYETDLKQYIEQLRRTGKMNKKVLFSAIVQVIEALSIIHKEKSYHRDLKQSNVLVRRYGPSPQHILVSLTDFGLSKSISDQQKEKDQSNSKTLSEITGKFQYLAPEAINAEQSSTYEYEKVDTWALGIMAYKILSGTSFIEQKDNTQTISTKDSYEYAIDKIIKKKSEAFTHRYLSTKYDEWKLQSSEEQYILYLLALTLCLEVENRFSVRDFKTRGQKSLRGLFESLRTQYLDQKNLLKAGKEPKFRIEQPELIMGFESSTLTPQQFINFLKDSIYVQDSHQL